MAQTLLTQSIPSSSFSLSRRKTLSKRSKCTTRIAQCTHITMTRVYNEDFRCALCLHPGSMGWLYRCTQDRELLIEDDLEKEHPVWSHMTDSGRILTMCIELHWPIGFYSEAIAITVTEDEKCRSSRFQQLSISRRDQPSRSENLLTWSD